MATVAELIEQLQELPEDAEVRLATQPSYPLAANINSELYFDEETGKVWVSERSLPLNENPYEVPREAFY